MCIDYFGIDNHSYLLIADYFSGWLCFYHFKHHQSTANALTNICWELFLHTVSLNKSSPTEDTSLLQHPFKTSSSNGKFTTVAHLLLTHSHIARLKLLLKHQRELLEKTFHLMVHWIKTKWQLPSFKITTSL